MSRRLFLLDGMALVYRAHFALIRSPIYSSKGVNTSALFGFTNTLLDLLQKQEPTHLAVAFDTSAPTSRHEMFPEYKAQREEMPEDLRQAIPNVKRLVKAFQLPVIEMDGYEADDTIGTLSRMAEADDPECEVVMVTPDKDFAQLVTDRSRIYKPGRQGSEPEILTLPDILTNWEIERADQVVDILGLWGDASDNIPGVPGVGEKTAKKLIKQFGSIETLLDSTDQLKGKQKENVENNREQALLSKKLAAIMTDAPVELDWEALEIGDRDDEAVKSLLVEFEFNALGKRLYGDAFKAGRGTVKGVGSGGSATLKKLEDVPHDYGVVENAREAKALLKTILAAEKVCFDLETTDLDPLRARILGIAFSWEVGKGSYVSFPSNPGKAQELLDVFALFFADSKIEKIGHNLKFDLGVLRWAGVEVSGPFFDTMLAHALIDPDQRHTMDYLAESFLGYEPISFKSLVGEQADKEDPQMTMLDTTLEDLSQTQLSKVADYATEDADVTFQLAEKFRPLLEDKGQHQVFYDIEAPLVPVLVAMEREGICIDRDDLGEIGKALGAKMAELEKRIFEAAGEPFNLNSPKQLGEILFDRLKLDDKPKKTKTGQYKTDEQVLSALAPHHVIVQDILDFREATKLKSTYVDALPGYIFTKTGRVHTTFHQVLTATGRLASNNPNLQNIPIRSELGREVRKAFVSRDENHLLLAADYSQIELRVMAALSEDPAMMEAFQNDADIHTTTAARVYGVEPDDVVSDMRRTAKMVNFGIIYGISAFGLSQRLGIARREAADIIEEYFRQYPGVKAYMERTVEEAKANGYVETVTGRRRYLRDINSGNATVRGAAERTAINTPIQGTAADMIKIAMVRVHRALAEGDFNTRMLLQVHDELVFDMAREEEESVVPVIVDAMKNAIPLSVPIVVETGTGENWLEAH
ncbi:MAG: DNA polymerase I [Verrucomicrobiota bacterium]